MGALADGLAALCFEKQVEWLEQHSDELSMYAALWIACVEALGRQAMADLGGDDPSVIICWRAGAPVPVGEAAKVAVLSVHLKADPARRAAVAALLVERRRIAIHPRKAVAA